MSLTFLCLWLTSIIIYFFMSHGHPAEYVWTVSHFHVANIVNIDTQHPHSYTHPNTHHPHHTYIHAHPGCTPSTWSIILWNNSSNLVQKYFDNWFHFDFSKRDSFKNAHNIWNSTSPTIIIINKRNRAMFIYIPNKLLVLLHTCFQHFLWFPLILWEAPLAYFHTLPLVKK